MSTALQQQRHQPISAQGEITRKGMPNRDDIRRRKQNAGDGLNAINVYRGGEDDTNHAIMPGELCFADRGGRVEKSYSGETFEYCYTTVAGRDFGTTSKSDEEFMRGIYFVGVAKTEDLASGTDFFGDQSLDHGFSILGAGSYSTWNNGPKDITAGDILAWQVPSTGRDENGVVMDRRQLDTGVNTISRNVAGSPWTKPLFQVVPFNPNDFTSQRHAIEAEISDSLNGIQNKPYADFRADGTNPISTVRGEAGALALGLLGFLSNYKPDTIFDDNLKQNVIDYGWTILSNDGSFTEKQISKLTDIMKLSKQNNPDWLSNIFRAATGCWYAKTSRIIGKAMNGTKPGGTLNVMFSHFKVGF